MATIAPKIDFIAKIVKLEKAGFLPTKRRGPTGIGYTLESALGIVENNDVNYDFVDIGQYNGCPFELKTQRNQMEDNRIGRKKINKSMITLVTQAPHGGLSNKELLNSYGYRDTKNKDRINLNTTLVCSRYVNGKNVRNIKLTRDGNILSINHRKDGNLSYYDLRKFGDKLRNLAVVRASSRICKCDCPDRELHDKETGNYHEYFHFNEFHIYQTIDLEKFYKLLDIDKVKIDLRMHISDSELKSNDSDPDHDHGTGFRMKFENIKDLYKYNKDG